MNRDDFLERLNRRGADRYRALPVTENVLADWLEAKIIPAPDKRGRVRDWKAKEYRRSLEIIRLKSHGVSDLGEIRFHLWMKACAVPYFLNETRDRNCILRAFRQLRNEATEHVHSTYPQVQNRDADGWPAKTVLRNMGKLDPSLAEFVQYDNSELLAMYRLLKEGDGDLRELNRAIKQLIVNTFRSLKIGFDEYDKVVEFCAAEVVKISGIFVGIFEKGRNSKGSGEWTILHATREQYEIAMQLYRLSVGFFRKAGLPKVANSLLHPNWRLMSFVLLISAINRVQKIGPPSVSTAPQIASLVSALIDKFGGGNSAKLLEFLAFPEG